MAGQPLQVVTRAMEFVVVAFLRHLTVVAPIFNIAGICLVRASVRFAVGSALVRLSVMTAIILDAVMLGVSFQICSPTLASQRELTAVKMSARVSKQCII